MTPVTVLWDPGLRGAPVAWEHRDNWPSIPTVGDHVANDASDVAEINDVIYALDGTVTVYITLCGCRQPPTFTPDHYDSWFPN